MTQERGRQVDSFLFTSPKLETTTEQHEYIICKGVFRYQQFTVLNHTWTLMHVYECAEKCMNEKDERTHFFLNLHTINTSRKISTKHIHTRETFSKKRTSGRWVNSDKDMIRKSCVYNDQFFSRVFENLESVKFLQKSSQTEWKLYIQKVKSQVSFSFFVCLCNVLSRKESKKSKSEKKPSEKNSPSSSFLLLPCSSFKDQRYLLGSQFRYRLTRYYRKSGLKKFFFFLLPDIMAYCCTTLKYQCDCNY